MRPNHPLSAIANQVMWDRLIAVVEEQAQTKVESSQRFPIKLTGMALVNAFVNSKQNGGSDYATAASATSGTDRGGATVRQSIIEIPPRM